jgi:hypothetical protein
MLDRQKDAVTAMFDVLYLDHDRHQKLVAGALTRESAVRIARSEARERRLGRMFAAGSDPGCLHNVIAIVESDKRTA